MEKNTQQVLLVGGGIAIVGIIIYMVFAPSGKSSTLSYTSGTLQTTPTTNTSITNAGIQVGTNLFSKLIDKFFSTTPPPPVDQTTV